MDYNPNDYKVAKFTNLEDFDFTPELGAMFDGRPFFVKSGETTIVPYPLAQHLALNLGKQALIRGAVGKEQNDHTRVASLWDEETLKKRADTYISDMYEEEKKKTFSATDIMMQKVEELNKIADVPSTGEYKDKAEVIAELEKREIKFDARMNKANLESLL